ncbi:hypothetical protein HPG69_006404, partial [Diceros bicornis minor]
MERPQLSAPGLGARTCWAQGEASFSRPVVRNLTQLHHIGEKPIPHPQIQTHSPSHTSGWCNVSCGTPGATENLTVTWLSKGLPRELEQRETGASPQLQEFKPEPAPEPVEWPPHLCGQQPCGREECNLTPGEHLSMGGFLSEQMERHLSHGSAGEPGAWSVDLDEEEDGDWERQVPGSAAVSQALPTEESTDLQTAVFDSHDPPYMMISLLRHPMKDLEEGSCHSYSPRACSGSPHYLREDPEMPRAPGGRLHHEDTGA